VDFGGLAPGVDSARMCSGPTVGAAAGAGDAVAVKCGGW
jgi:hypothetical protein